MPNCKKQRKSFSLRLQPYEGSPLSVVVDYLNSLERDELRRHLNDALVAFFYPYALKESGKENLRNSFLISRDIANKHFGIMALSLNLEAIVVASIVSSGITGSNVSWESDQSKPVNSSQESDQSEDLIETDFSTSEVRNLFGF